MRAGNLYKHENNTDVALYPVRSPFYVPEKKIYKVKCRWFNIVNPLNVYDMGIVDNVVIKAEDIRKWKFYEPKSIPEQAP